MKEIRVLLVDDHQLITDGLKSLLEDVKGIRVVGSATNGKEALELLKILEIHLVLMDVDMPVMNGLDAAKVMKVTHGSIKVIILSMHGEQSLVRELVGMGVDGYLLKNTTKDELVSAIQKVHAGARYFSSDVTLSLINKKEDVIYIDIDAQTQTESNQVKPKDNKEIPPLFNILNIALSL